MFFCVLLFTPAMVSFLLVWGLVVVGSVFVTKGAWWMPWHAEPMKDV